jgi:hypothetical protein
MYQYFFSKLARKKKKMAIDLGDLNGGYCCLVFVHAKNRHWQNQVAFSFQKTVSIRLIKMFNLKFLVFTCRQHSNVLLIFTSDWNATHTCAPDKCKNLEGSKRFAGDSVPVTCNNFTREDQKLLTSSEIERTEIATQAQFSKAELKHRMENLLRKKQVANALHF